MDRRKDQRSITREAVRARIAGRDAECIMRNLSQSGCLVEGAALPAEIGAPITIVLSEHLSVDGQIAWQLGEGMGVVFARPIPPDVVRSFALDDWPARANWDHAGVVRASPPRAE